MFLFVLIGGAFEDVRGSDISIKVDSLLRQAGRIIDNNPDSSYNIAIEVMETHGEEMSDKQHGRALFYAGLSKNYLGAYEDAYGLLKKAIDLQEANDFLKQQASSLQAFGLVCENRGLPEKALESYTKAFGIYEQLNNEDGKSRSLLNIGCVLIRKKDHVAARDYMNRSLAIARHSDDKNTMALAYNNLGILSDVEGDQDKALEFYNRSMKLQQELGNSRVVASLLNNIAMIYSDRGDYELALQAFNRSVSIKKELQNEEGLANTYNSIGEILLNKHQYEPAYQRISRALSIGKKYTNWEIIKNSNILLADYFIATGDASKAIEFLKQASVANDSLYDLKIARQLTEMQTRFESKQKEKQNILLRERVSHHRSWLVMVGVIAVIALALVLVLYRMFRLRSVSLEKTRTILSQEKKMAELEKQHQQSEVKRLESEKKRKESENRLLEKTMKAREEINRLEREKLNAVLDMRSKELSSITLHLISKNDILHQIGTHIRNINGKGEREWEKSVKTVRELISEHIDPELNWRKYKLNFDKANPGYFDRILQQYPDLTETEQKLCAFLRINLQSKEIAQIMNTSLAAVNKGRQRLRKRLGLSQGADLHEFLITI